jgi:outer membrane murein-binding lipoprotein Lpp
MSVDLCVGVAKAADRAALDSSEMELELSVLAEDDALWRGQVSAAHSTHARTRARTHITAVEPATLLPTGPGGR